MLIGSMFIFVVVQRGNDFWENGMNQGKLERSPVVIVTACMKARKYKTLIRTASTMGRQKSIQIQPVTT